MIILEEQLVNSDTIFENYHSLDVQENQGTTNLNLCIIHSENARPVANALISVDAIGKTAVCCCEGQVCLTELKSGHYLVDVIAPGFIAQRVSILLPIAGPGQIRVKMISNN